jgi:Tfp pilus assembly protein PilN
MDLNKEIKLSDLFKPRRRESAGVGKTAALAAPVTDEDKGRIKIFSLRRKPKRTAEAGDAPAKRRFTFTLRRKAKEQPASVEPAAEAKKRFSFSWLRKPGRRVEAFDEFAAESGSRAGKKLLSISLRRRAKEPQEPGEPKEPKAPKVPKVKQEKSSTVIAGQLDVPLMRAFNLLPRDDVREARTSRPNTAQLALAVVGLVSLAGLGSVFMILNAGVVDKRTTRDELKVQVQAAQAAQRDEDEPVQEPIDPAVLEEQNARTTALSSALGTRVAWDRVMRELSLVTPDDVWLSGLIAAPGAPPEGAAAPASDSGEPAPQPAVPSSLTINGYAHDQQGVARFLARLSVVPELMGVQLLSSTAALIGETEVVQFSVSALVKLPGGATA